ncbi:MAG: hypothetical protein HY394_01440 [Candidatus Diapherotrites archaeon]|nr:hypothetical protein [Candidatus Diapherotrites archaeon]
MPPHSRPARPADVSARPQSYSASGGGASSGISAMSLREDIKALNSAILVLSQKMKFVVRNEKILGRNLLVLNKKFKGFEEPRQNGASSDSGGLASEDIEKLLLHLQDLSGKVDELEAKLKHAQETSVSKEQFAELKYVIDAINPLDFVTIAQAKELIDKRLAKDSAGESKKEKKK